MTWRTVISEIENRKLASRTWVSDQQSLIEIMEIAQEWGLDPVPAAKANYSQLREIIPHAKSAIFRADRSKLARLFEMAATLSIVEIRLQLGKRSLDKIPVYPDKDAEFCTIRLSRRQLERIKKSTRLYFDFIEEQGSTKEID